MVDVESHTAGTFIPSLTVLQELPLPSSDRFLATLEQLLAIRSTELDEALDQAADLVAQALGADKVDAFLYEPESESLVAAGTSRTPMGRRQHEIGMDRLPLANGGRTVEVFQSHTSRLSGRADQDPGELRGITEGLGVRSTVCASFGQADNPRGVLSVASATPDLWTVDDLRFVEAAAGWVGMVAARAELAHWVAEQAEEQGRRAAADELIAILAHDLRNYLSPLRGRLQLLRRVLVEQSQTAGALRHVDELGNNVDRLSRLVSNLLDSARLEHGLFTLDTRRSDLVSLVRDVADALGTGPGRVHVEADADELWAVVDPERIRQAVENLLANALKFSPENTLVQLHVRREQGAEGEWAYITVTDQGPGIPRELQGRLFERFATGAARTGLGLGLYLARRVADAHGGSLTVDSAVGMGARFTLGLPVLES